MATRPRPVRSRTTPSPPPRRDLGRARGEPIAAEVLARTLDELVEHGIEALSVERIARAAEVNKTSVYRRWPTREALIAAALARVLDDLSVALPDTGTLRGDLEAMIRATAGFMDSPLGRALAGAALGGFGVPPTAIVAQRAAAQPDRGAAALVARARARGEWRDDADPEVVLSALLGAITQRVLLERREATATWVDAVIDLTLRAVRP